MKSVLRNTSSSLQKSLLSNQVKTVASLVTCDAARIASKDVKEELVDLQKTLVDKFSCFPLTGSHLLDDVLSSFFILPTGCDHWDELLDGGFYSGEVTEIVGCAGSGKTQVCMSIASFISMTLEKTVVYIDTQGSFCSGRIKEMLNTKDKSLSEKDISNILSRIRCFQAFDSFSLMECLDSLKESLFNEGDEFFNNLQLIVVDSIAAVITPVLGGQQITGHSIMIHLSRILKSLAVLNGLAVLVTNNVVSDNKASFTGGIKPALGQTWSHIPSTRIFIQKGPLNKQNQERIAIVTKSSRQPVHISTTFHIHKAGIIDNLQAFTSD